MDRNSRSELASLKDNVERVAGRAELTLSFTDSVTIKGSAKDVWVSAGHIARLWRIPPGSVYRHAGEQRWRRRTRGGRTYYHGGDVRRTLEGRR